MMIEHDHSGLSLRKQAALLGVNRNRLHPRRLSSADQELIQRLDRLHPDDPSAGSRRMAALLRREGLRINRKRIQRLMRHMGLHGVAPGPRTSTPCPGHKKYPYLLRERTVSRTDEVWCADITYIPMPRGYAYLVAMMDWHSRAVLAWRISNTLDTRFCVEALEEATRSTGRTPEIFNTDQGCQFTSAAWIDALEGRGIKVSMDGRGRWMDNVFIERLWRSLKYEDVYLRAYESLPELHTGLTRWFEHYNHRRPHQSLRKATPFGDAVPWEVYDGRQELAA